MKVSLIKLSAISFLWLTACSTQPVPLTPDPGVKKMTEAIAVNNEQNSGQPPMTLLKNNEILTLVKSMEGGVCKNELEGVKGTFLIYVKKEDIERIKREKGMNVFADFETQIEAFSSEVLEELVDTVNFVKDPFAFDDEDARQKLAAQFATDFHQAVTPKIEHFQQETTLTIDIEAFPASFTFYQQGCSATEEPAEYTRVVPHSK